MTTVKSPSPTERITRLEVQAENFYRIVNITDSKLNRIEEKIDMLNKNMYIGIGKAKTTSKIWGFAAGIVAAIIVFVTHLFTSHH